MNDQIFLCFKKDCSCLNVLVNFPKEMENMMKDYELQMGLASEQSSTEKSQELKIDIAEASLRNFQKVAMLKYDQLEINQNMQNKIIQDLQDLISDQQKDANIVQLQFSQKINEIQNKIIPVELTRFTWNTIHTQVSVQIHGNSIKNTYNGRHNCVFLDPQMNHSSVMKVQVKMTNNSENVALNLCNLKIIKTKCPRFQEIYQSQGQVTHYFNGNTSFNGAQRFGGFSFDRGDIIEMQWNGPLGKFTTVNMSTRQKHEFIVDFNFDAEIYFGVSLYHQDQEVQIA